METILPAMDETDLPESLVSENLSQYLENINAEIFLDESLKEYKLLRNVDIDININWDTNVESLVYAKANGIKHPQKDYVGSIFGVNTNADNRHEIERNNEISCVNFLHSTTSYSNNTSKFEYSQFININSISYNKKVFVDNGYPVNVNNNQSYSECEIEESMINNMDHSVWFEKPDDKNEKYILLEMASVELQDKEECKIKSEDVSMSEDYFQNELQGKDYESVVMKCHTQSHEENNDMSEYHEIKYVKKRGRKKKLISNDCDVCGKIFTSYSNLNSHYRIHTGIRPYECSLCGKKFKQQGHLKSHVMTHTGERPFPCEFCEASFIQGTSLKIHLEKIHTKEKPQKAVESNKVVTNFFCKFCDRTYIGKSYKKDHMKTHNISTTYSCKACPKVYKGRKYYERHMKSHSDLLFNHILESSPRRKINLKKKVETKTIFDKYVKVEINEYDEKMYHCKVCYKVFKRSTNMHLHLRIHTGAKPYKCDVCHMYFRQISHLKDHYSCHTGVQCYCCTICGRNFSRYSTVSNHLKVRHPRFIGSITKSIVPIGGDSNGNILVITESVNTATVEIQISDS